MLSTRNVSNIYLLFSFKPVLSYFRIKGNTFSFIPSLIVLVWTRTSFRHLPKPPPADCVPARRLPAQKFRDFFGWPSTSKKNVICCRSGRSGLPEVWQRRYRLSFSCAHGPFWCAPGKFRRKTLRKNPKYGKLLSFRYRWLSCRNRFISLPAARRLCRSNTAHFFVDTGFA